MGSYVTAYNMLQKVQSDLRLNSEQQAFWIKALKNENTIDILVNVIKSINQNKTNDDHKASSIYFLRLKLVD